MSDRSTDFEDRLRGPSKAKGVEIRGPMAAGYAKILNPDASALLAELSSGFEERKVDLLEKRRSKQEKIMQGRLLDFLEETVDIRNGDWRRSKFPRSPSDMAELTNEDSTVIGQTKVMCGVFVRCARPLATVLMA